MLPETIKVPERAVNLMVGMAGVIFVLSLLLVGMVTYTLTRGEYSTIERDKYLIDKFFTAYPSCGTAAAHVENMTELHVSCFDENKRPDGKGKGKRNTT